MWRICDVRPEVYNGRHTGMQSDESSVNTTRTHIWASRHTVLLTATATFCRTWCSRIASSVDLGCLVGCQIVKVYHHSSDAARYGVMNALETAPVRAWALGREHLDK
ncbi:hypothetical protein WOLCODRAFT_135181 [Wolfiporia cocos MD-104 SS10]|uniref:Uncharacterized protein n=1 Tax=Wolfiporia cocos (strain MD-104) TaxID=742152 RepID=A0A2H3IU78_WOLCO|nr:hypothetical protein WOLCODRAFT_135181 [Wolfiporia cocos MD-104 SS10]